MLFLQLLLLLLYPLLSSLPILLLMFEPLSRYPDCPCEIALVSNCILYIFLYYYKILLQFLQLTIFLNYCQMLSFGQAKNSIEKLKNYLKKMQVQSKTQKITLKQIEQQNLRSANNEIFLPLLNFILIQFSSQLYIRILDRVPDLKLKDDRKFIENCLNIAREMLGVTPGLTADQFLTNKYFEKKLQFLANLSKSAYQWCTQIKKGKTKQKQISNQTNIQTFASNQYNASKLTMQYLDNQLDDFEQEVPMKITAVPMKIDISQLNNQNKNTKVNNNNFFTQENKKATQLYDFSHTNNDPQKNKTSSKYTPAHTKNKFVVQGQEFDEHQIQFALQERHPTPQGHLRKPNEQPISITDRTRNKEITFNKKQLKEDDNQQWEQQEKHAQQQEDHYDKFRLEQNKKKQANPSNLNQKADKKSHKITKNKEHEGQKHKYHKNQQQHIFAHKNPQDYVTKTQFNSLILLIKQLSETVNKISIKFVELQTNVNTQINNLSARVMMLESKVRVLQDNL